MYHQPSSLSVRKKGGGGWKELLFFLLAHVGRWANKARWLRLPFSIHEHFLVVSMHFGGG